MPTNQHAAARILVSSVPHPMRLFSLLFVVGIICVYNLAVHDDETREDPTRRINDGVRLNVCEDCGIEPRATTSNSNRDVYPFYNTIIFYLYAAAHAYIVCGLINAILSYILCCSLYFIAIDMVPSSSSASSIYRKFAARSHQKDIWSSIAGVQANDEPKIKNIVDRRQRDSRMKWMDHFALPTMHWPMKKSDTNL